MHCKKQRLRKLCAFLRRALSHAMFPCAGFCIAAALLFHASFVDRNQLLHFEKDLAIAGGLLALFACGAGRYSLERGSR